jgi:peptidoglycan/LPS O-acetylase OafA/YrhL
MRRYEALDGLRGCAAIFVVFYHLRMYLFPQLFYFARNGFYCVDLFFILSGFVISAAYSKRLETNGDVVSFLIARIFRLWPLHAFWLLVILIAKVSGSLGFDATAGTLISNSMLIQSWGLLDIHHVTWNVPSWSISAELMVCVLYAATIRLITPPKVFWLYVAMIGFVVYAFLLWRYGTLDIVSRPATLRGLFGFAIGAAIFQFKQKYSSNSFQAMVCIAVIACLTCIDEPDAGICIPLFGAMIVVLLNDTGPIAWLLTTKPLMIAGELSYSVYLAHYPVILVVRKYLPHFHNPYYISAALVTTVVSISFVTFHLIEKPSRSLGRNLASQVRMSPRFGY